MSYPRILEALIHERARAAAWKRLAQKGDPGVVVLVLEEDLDRAKREIQTDFPSTPRNHP